MIKSPTKATSSSGSATITVLSASEGPTTSKRSGASPTVMVSPSDTTTASAIASRSASCVAKRSPWRSFLAAMKPRVSSRMASRVVASV